MTASADKGSQTERICVQHSGLVERLDGIIRELNANSKDTRETKKLLVGLLVSIVIAGFGYFLKGCCL